MVPLQNIPHDPGCYLFKDSHGKIIYIGKAKDLKKRVSSYFLKKDHDPKTAALVSSINDVEFFITSNEVEALILESNLILKHKPKYNILLKESRRYAFILVTEERYPRLMVARDKEQQGRYYGPYVSAEQRDMIIKSLRSAFLIRTCSKMPKKACLRYHLRLCSAPCIGAISEEEYSSSIKDAEHYLKGNEKELALRLKQEMREFSSRMMYEKAKIIRDQIAAIDEISTRQKFEQDKRYDEDMINYIISDGKVYLIVFNIIKGMLAAKKEYVFDYSGDFLEEFITQHYADNPVPREIILPCELNDSSIKQYLEKMRDGAVNINVPKKGDKLELLYLVRRNIEAAFFAESQMVNSLRDELSLNSNPNVIECFDISNISGTSSVGSMVQFRNAKPDKPNYRRFKIKTVVGSDDFASIKEIVMRRYSRLKVENLQMPDLIVIDGGPGQLNSALSALNELGLKIPIISLAKKLEEIYLPGRLVPLRLKRDSKALRLLIQIRDEAHRFAINYHRLVRSKEMMR